MCTIITADSSVEKQQVIERMLSDSLRNDDGFALALYVNGSYTVLKTMDIETIINMVLISDYDRLWFHSRFATRGLVTVAHTHGFRSKHGHIVMHNGTIRRQRSGELLLPQYEPEVDSVTIADWLNEGNETRYMAEINTLDSLQAEPYSNVFLINTIDGYYHVHRNTHGTLYTDGNGNYSTNAFGDIIQPVSKGTQSCHHLEELELDYQTTFDVPMSPKRQVASKLDEADNYVWLPKKRSSKV